MLGYSQAYSKKILQKNKCQQKLCQDGKIINQRKRSYKQIRIKEDNHFLSKSFEILFPIKYGQQNKQRRKSGIDNLSSKQLRLDFNYPMTIVSQLQILQDQQQRTKERKKTLFKRMSSILIKNQDAIRNYKNKSRRSKQDLIEEQMMLQKNNDEPINNQQKEVESPNTSQRKSIKKKPLRLRISNSEQNKVYFNLYVQSKKPCLAIKNYIEGKNNELKSFGKSQIDLNYNSIPSLSELQEIVLSSPKSQKKNPLTLSCSQLFDQRGVKTERTKLIELNTMKQKIKPLYTSSRRKLTLKNEEKY